ncbi:hypothetical protein FH972_011682 [Carpinus fangiana]|uniref:Uncharacterized protein n=1 Tax=Carpinus fangiana TaxID=176857 RepID=A0A660KTX6_9ROSI|nr:hypothetical protein FH972_011682 [Carpinus fangiana]
MPFNSKGSSPATTHCHFLLRQIAHCQAEVTSGCPFDGNASHDPFPLLAGGPANKTKGSTRGSNCGWFNSVVSCLLHASYSYFLFSRGTLRCLCSVPHELMLAKMGGVVEGQGLSLSLSSSLQHLEAAKVEELRMEDGGILYYNQAGGGSSSGQYYKNPLHLQGVAA